MAAEVDLRVISSFASVSEPQVAALLASPTTELVKSLLQSIESKARDYEQLKTQRVRLEVELETSVRTSESKVKVLKSSVEKSLAESSKLRIELQNSENTRSKLESEIEQVRKATTQDASETIALKSRVSSLEASNRETLAVVESKTTAYEKLVQELSTRQEKALELRKQAAALEQTVQAANSAAAAAKFREQNLEQELNLLRRNNEWLENELKTKSAEHLKFRKDKNARISELSSQTEQYISETEALRRSEAALRSRLDEQIQKVEDLTQEIQQLREEKISDVDAFRLELESAGRLAELQQASATTAKQRAEQLSLTVQEIKDEAAEEIGRLRAEVETEHQDKEAAERRVAELESTVQQLESEMEQNREQSQPVTPQRPINGGDVSTPARPGTPTGIFSPASTSRLKGNLTMTQMYSEYKRLERELANERQSTEQLQASLDAMLEDLEANRPEIEELRADHRRLQSEIVEMSSLVQNANRERDAAIKEARKYHGQAESQGKEARMLLQQGRDANAQIKILLMEQDIREKGQELSPEDLAELQKLARGDISHLSATGRVISESLTTFRNLAELQEQNSKILRMLRELGEQMETNEAREKDDQRRSEHEELEAARARILGYQDELKFMLAQQQTFTKERDMYRNMLTRKGHFPQIDSTDFARSMPLPADSPHALDESMPGSVAGGENEHARVVRELQSHFDSFRQETLTDQKALKHQVNELSKRNSQLQTEASKILSQLSAANQRSEMLQANFNALKTENAEIQKRSYSIMETATKQELKTQQAAEELVETKGLIDGMRREAANLKAEKDLWKNVEKRLIDDNESLRNERGRLDHLNGSLQTMLSEREQSDSETRRRLQAQMETLEVELQATKRKLNDEVDESRKAALRREYEHEQSQKRIEDLVTSLGNVREELAAAKTSRDHLQARVDEMTVDLRSAEERIAVFTQPASESIAEDATGQGLVSREQELAVEISELRRDLDLKTAELNRTIEQVEVYKSISQQSEERLQEFTETNEKYREETESALEEKEKIIKDLRQRIEDITSELSTTNTELSQLRDEQSESSRRLDEQRSTFEAEITRLKEEADRNAEQAQYNLEASKEQGRIATDNQQAYENELLKHADATKTLTSMRAEMNQLRLDLLEVRTQAEIATRDLLQKEESWTELKSRYDQELSDLKQRREDLMQQNTLLHNQLEGVTNQVTAIQRDRAATADSEVNTTADSGLDNLQEVVKYLRREKDIVDVQYHLSTQEAKRLRQQLDFAQSQLDETRLKLDQQRRTEADSEQNALNHSKLMETLNELNLYRESSVTLRAENRHITQSLTEKTQRIEDLTGQLEPLQTRIAELENLSELRDGEMKLLQEDRDHWQQRTQNILSKYDRVDPAELESLKEKMTGLERERDDIIASRDALQNQVDGFPEQLEASKQELRSRLAEQFKARSKILSERTKEKQTEVDATNAEKAALQTQLDSMKEELDSARSQAVAGHNVTNGIPGAESESNPTTTTSESDINGRVAELQTKITQLETALTEKEQQIVTLESSQDEKFKAKEEALKAILNKRLSEVKTQAQTAQEQALRDQREQMELSHKQALETLHAQSTSAAAEVQTHAGAAPETVGEQTHANPSGGDLPILTEEQAKALVQKNEVIRNILRTNIRKSVEKKEEALRKEFELAQAATGDTTSPEQVADLEAKIQAATDALRKEKDEQFDAEKQALIRKHEERLASEKQSLIVQQQERLMSEKLNFSQEAEKKIADQVALAEKRTFVKLNLTENRLRQSSAKIDVVKKAAEETPQKPVIEVWNIAKDAKAAPIAQSQIKTAAAAPQAAASASSAADQKATTNVGSSGLVPSQRTPQAELPAVLSSAQLTEKNTKEGSAPNGVVKSTQANTASGAQMLRQLQSGLPRGGIRGGRGGGQSAQPQQVQPSNDSQQPPTRGTGIPRAGSFRGSRGGRAGAQNVQTNIPQVQGAGRGGGSVGGSPRGNLNPQATQFQPQGNKRARSDGDGGDGGDAGNMGKRIRGGGAGSG